MVNDASDDRKVLDYGRFGIEQPPRTRIVVRHDPGALRFIDPPLRGTHLERRILLKIALRIALALIVVPAFLTVMRFPRAAVVICTAGIIILNGWGPIRYWYYAASHATFIDVTPGMLAVTLPNLKRILVPIKELQDIRASKPRRVLGSRGRTSSLVISSRGRQFWILRYRDYIEARWIARQLRSVAGMPLDHPREPQIVADSQDVRESEKTWSGPLPSLPDENNASVRLPENFRQTLDREYNNLGCAATLFLFAVEMAGLYLVVRLVDVLIICLEFGSNAYFHEGLHYMPHRPDLLSNGQMTSPGFRFISLVACFIGTAIWTPVALFAGIAVNHLLDAIHKRLRRARK